jgi:hypothetical protein
MSTYAELLTRKADYLAAEAKVLQAQEYTVGQGGTARRLTRADLAEIRKAIADLDLQLAEHPDNPDRLRRPRRVSYLRPLG